MAVAHSDTAIDSFSELEKRLAAFLRVVPFNSEHQRVHSAVLASLLLDSCSLIESVLKSAMDNARYNGVANIALLRNKRYALQPPHLNINDLRVVFRADLFYVKRVWLLSQGDVSIPWYVWRQPQAAHPKWWRAYNDVKHSRLDNASRATLGATVHAMEALFLVLVQCLDYRARLIERGIIRSRTLTTAALTAAATNWETLPTQATVVAVSELFAYKFASAGSASQAVDQTVFL